MVRKLLASLPPRKGLPPCSLSPHLTGSVSRADLRITLHSWHASEPCAPGFVFSRAYRMRGERFERAYNLDATPHICTPPAYLLLAFS